MKIIIKDSFGNFFYRKPEVGFFENKQYAHVFTCINEEHIKIILEKTKQFTFRDDLFIEEVNDDQEKENKTEKSKKNNDNLLCKNV